MKYTDPMEKKKEIDTNMNKYSFFYTTCKNKKFS